MLAATQQLHRLPNLFHRPGNSGGQLEIAGLSHPKRPDTTHRRQRHRPEYVRKVLLPIFHPLPRHAHASGRERGLVPFQQNQIGPPGIVPAGRFENLVRLGGVNKALGREVGADKKAGLLGVGPIGGLGEAV